MYSEIAFACYNKSSDATFPLLTTHQILAFDMDSLFNNMEKGMIRFITRIHKLNAIRAWSSLVKLADVDELMDQNTSDSCDMIHAAVASFYERIADF
jgi:hypothetical protein